MRALDLFCGAGGAAMGLHRAGFEVVGVDINPQPRYPFMFVQGDALKPPMNLQDFDFIWASPPCQAHTDLRFMWNALDHEDMIPETRALLIDSGVAWVIENVPDAPLRPELHLCGTMFNLGWRDAELWRHRHFETSFQVPLFAVPPCRHHRRKRVIGVYGGHGRDRRRKHNTQDFPMEARRKAMGIDWMTGQELSESIPPAYSEFIGKAALAQIRAELD